MTFDRIAPTYQFFETIAFGYALQRARTAFISRIRDGERVLILGEGDGRFLAELLRRDPFVEVDCIDASAAMIQRARARAAVIPSKAKDLTSVDGAVCAPRDSASLPPGELCRVQFHHIDILGWVPLQKSYDVVVTHFFLDCFTSAQLPAVVEKIGNAATPNARWLFADFAIPTKALGGVHARVWLRIMYSFFRAVADLQAKELTDASALIQANGFRLYEEKVTRLGFIKSQVWERNA